MDATRFHIAVDPLYVFHHTVGYRGFIYRTIPSICVGSASMLTPAET